MKKRNKRIFWVVVLLVLVSVSTLSVLGYKKSHNNKDKDENNVVKDNVKIITEESDKQPILVEDDKITFDSNPRYKKGDVIVSGITSSAPNGFIRNVTGVQKTKGKYIIQTEPAVLTDVFEKAHIYKRIELAESQNELFQIHRSHRIFCAKQKMRIMARIICLEKVLRKRKIQSVCLEKPEQVHGLK